MENEFLKYLYSVKNRINENGMYSNCPDDTNWYKAQLELINEIINYIEKK